MSVAPVTSRARPVGVQASRTVPTAGPRVVKWIEKHCVFTKGRWMGQPFRLLPWQVEFIYALYEQREVGRDAKGKPIYQRRYRRALLGVPKKNGKTELAAAIALYETMGGKEPQPEVYVAANSDDQANLVFGSAAEMVRLSPTLSQVAQKFSSSITVPRMAGSITRLSSKAKTKDGLNVHLAVFDEFHEFDEAGEQLYTVISNGVGARVEPLILCITTAGFDLDSVCGRMYQHGLKVQSGEVQDPTFLFRWYGAVEGSDYRDPAVWAAANPSYGEIVSAEFYEEQLKSKPEAVFRRYFLNQWTETEEAWLPMGAWPGCTALTLKPVDGAPTVVGWDAARRKDSTAVVWAQRLGERVVGRCRVWEAPAGEDGRPDPAWRTPTAEIMEHLRDLATRYDVRAVGYDPWGIKESVQQLEVEGLPMEEVPQTNARMVPATEYLFELITDGVWAHDGDPTWARHMRNTVARNVTSGVRMDKGRARRPMDAAIATAIVAYLLQNVELEDDSGGPTLW